VSLQKRREKPKLMVLLSELLKIQTAVKMIVITMIMMKELKMMKMMK
jgi:hypothetical protein